MAWPILSTLRNLARRPAEAKASAVGPIIALHSGDRPVWTPRNFSALAREGFQRNPVVYRCARLVAEACASIPLALTEAGRPLTIHPLLSLIARPNPNACGQELFESLHGFLQVAGNAYLEVVAVDGRPRELHVLRPDRMKVVPGPDGWPAAYEYSANGETHRFETDGGDGPVLHLTLFNPLDDHYGMSPLEAAQAPIDVHNAAGGWEKSLLDNAARPSGALVYKGPDDAPHLSEEQFERLKAQLSDDYQGARNAGRPMLLEGGLEWRQMSFSPSDMEFSETRAMAAREIALAFGVPPMLLGIPGDNTYSNYREANRAFYRQTVLPLARKTAAAIDGWLSPRFGSDLRLKPALDAVDALADERDAVWRRIAEADFLQPNEKRAAVGYPPLQEEAADSMASTDDA